MRVPPALREKRRGARTFFLRVTGWESSPCITRSRVAALLFSSEVRSLLASGQLQPRVSPDSLEAYLTFGSVAEPSTLVEGVFSVPPGHCLAFTADSPPEKPPKPYWVYSDAVLQQEGPKPKNFQEAAKLLRPLLEETVRDHLIADVPLGVFLSSGLDSTSLVALGSRFQSDLHTFTVVFPEQRYSEAKISRETAKRFKTRHQEILLAPDTLVAQLDDAVKSLDQPTMDGLNTYFVSRAARQGGLKVALSGLGSDEIFGGYSTFESTPRAAFVAGLGRWIPGPFRRLTAAAAVRIAAGDAVRKAAAAWRSPKDFPHAYYFTRLLFTPSRVRRLLAPYFESEEYSRDREYPWRARMRETARQAGQLDSFTSVSCFELQSYMVNTLLRDTDAASMANSLEVRVPFLDHRLVEFVGRLPKSAKYTPDVPKSLLVEALSDLLPDEVVGQSKRTFTLPWDVWLRGPLGVRLSQDLANLTPPLRQYMNPRAVRGAWQNFRHRPDQLVASLELVCAQRMGSPPRDGGGEQSSLDRRCRSHRRGFSDCLEPAVLREGKTTPDVHPGNQCLPRQCLRGNRFRRPPDRRRRRRTV